MSKNEKSILSHKPLHAAQKLQKLGSSRANCSGIFLLVVFEQGSDDPSPTPVWRREVSKIFRHWLSTMKHHGAAGVTKIGACLGNEIFGGGWFGEHWLNALAAAETIQCESQENQCVWKKDAIIALGESDANAVWLARQRDRKVLLAHPSAWELLDENSRQRYVASGIRPVDLVEVRTQAATALANFVLNPDAIIVAEEQLSTAHS